MKEEKSGGKEEEKEEKNDAYRRKEGLDYWVQRLKPFELDEQSRQMCSTFLNTSGGRMSSSSAASSS